MTPGSCRRRRAAWQQAAKAPKGELDIAEMLAERNLTSPSALKKQVFGRKHQAPRTPIDYIPG
jgi:hypothetical protein